MKIYQKTNITSGTLVHSGACVLRYIVINTKNTGGIAVSDAITATTPVVASFSANAPEGTYRFDCVMATGIYVDVSATSPDITVVWEKL